jgi:hypothetical protein
MKPMVGIYGAMDLQMASPFVKAALLWGKKWVRDRNCDYLCQRA